MRILVLMNRFPWPLKDGGTLAYYQLLKGLKLAGMEVHAAVLNTSKHWVDFNQLPEDVQQLANFHLVEIDNRVKPLDALVNLAFSNKSYHVTRFDNPDFRNMLGELLAQFTFEIVLFESVIMGVYLNTVRENTQAKCVLRSHNVEFEIWESLAGIEKNPIKKFYLNSLAKRLRKFETSCMQGFDGMVCFTPQDQKRFRELGFNKPLEVIPVGADISRLQPDERAIQPMTLLHLGSLDWMPNQEAVNWFIQEAWPSLHRQYPQLIFKVAGRNMPDYFKAYQGNGIEILGEVEDAIQLMKESAIMVVPLFSGSGIRVKVIEGLAMGKCMVVSEMGCSGIYAKSGKELHIANTAREFIQTIGNLVNNPELIAETGRNARQLIEQFYEQEKVTADLLAFFNTRI